jgi:phenylalanyl-tRNA synthetase beta chain
MPPIINSHETGKVSEKTKEVFIECSGFNLAYLKKTINIICCALIDIGAEVYQMKIINGHEEFLSPNLNYEKIEFQPERLIRPLVLIGRERDSNIG